MGVEETADGEARASSRRVVAQWEDEIEEFLACGTSSIDGRQSAESVHEQISVRAECSSSLFEGSYCQATCTCSFRVSLGSLSPQLDLVAIPV